jgi:hypothetical protein
VRQPDISWRWSSDLRMQSAGCATASGVAAGITHSVWMYFGGGRVAPFPPIPRSRWSHCKQLVPSVARKAAQHMVITLVTVCCVLAASGNVNLLPLSVVAWMQLCVSTWLFACAALFGRHMLVSRSRTRATHSGTHISHSQAVVHTERLRFLPVASDPDSAALTQPLRAALTARYTREDQFGLHLAFEDLCFVAEKDAARRHAVFADKTGASWSELCKAALRPVGEAVSVIAEVLQSESARGSAKQRLRVRAHLAANQQLLCWSVRALASLGHASRSQDRYGWAQLREPMVGEVLSMLLSLHLALRAWEASFPPPAVSLAPRLPRAAPEPAAVVADVLHVGIATLARGAGSLEALRTSAAAPLFGSRGEQERCLAACG